MKQVSDVLIFPNIHSITVEFFDIMNHWQSLIRGLLAVSVLRTQNTSRIPGTFFFFWYMHCLQVLIKSYNSQKSYLTQVNFFAFNAHSGGSYFHKSLLLAYVASICLAYVFISTQTKLQIKSKFRLQKESSSEQESTSREKILLLSLLQIHVFNMFNLHFQLLIKRDGN